MIRIITITAIVLTLIATVTFAEEKPWDFERYLEEIQEPAIKAMEAFKKSENTEEQIQLMEKSLELNDVALKILTEEIYAKMLVHEGITEDAEDDPEFYNLDAYKARSMERRERFREKLQQLRSKQQESE